MIQKKKILASGVLCFCETDQKYFMVIRDEKDMIRDIGGSDIESSTGAHVNALTSFSEVLRSPTSLSRSKSYLSVADAIEPVVSDATPAKILKAARWARE